MSLRPTVERSALLRRALLCWIVVALSVQGSTAALVQMLGPSHRHEIQHAQAGSRLLDRIEDAFRDVRAWRAQLRRQLLPDERPHVHADGVVHAHDENDSARAKPVEAGHAHAHSLFQRHHHAYSDASVVALDRSGDAAADGTAQAGAGSITLPLALPGAWVVPQPLWRLMPWPATSTQRWVDAPSRGSERPPRV